MSVVFDVVYKRSCFQYSIHTKEINTIQIMTALHYFTEDKVTKQTK